VSISDYLSGLEEISVSLSGSNSITYLAAAVSDFYIPPDLVAEHKIQSGGNLNLEMIPVPKLLGKVKTWNKETYLISFKLETDAQILEKKAKGAIEKYGVDMVVANELKTRRSQVVIYH
jgi:phosphopantothenate-cysteine ligase